MNRSVHPSRERVLAALRVAPAPMRLPALCARVGLSANATRSHLRRLAADGLVRIDHEKPHGPGRPAALYSAVPAEVALHRRLARSAPLLPEEAAS